MPLSRKLVAVVWAGVPLTGLEARPAVHGLELPGFRGKPLPRREHTDAQSHAVGAAVSGRSSRHWRRLAGGGRVVEHPHGGDHSCSEMGLFPDLPQQPVEPLQKELRCDRGPPQQGGPNKRSGQQEQARARKGLLSYQHACVTHAPACATLTCCRTHTHTRPHVDS